MRATSILFALAAGGGLALAIAAPVLAQDQAQPAQSKAPTALAPSAMSASTPTQPARSPDSQSALAPFAMTQTAASPDDNAIVVTGKANAKPAEIRQQAHDITRTAVKYRNPLAKFQDKVCPGIVGMPQEMAEIMVDRIRYNAERVGLDVAKEGKCDPNILVLFVRNGQGVMKELQKTKGYLFRRMDGVEMRELTRKGPVRVWTNTEIRSRQGDTLQGDNTGDLTQIPTLNIAQSQSHIFLAHRLDITNSVILIDIPAINGMSVVQIADYVTMRAFAETKPVDGDAAATTVLTLFNPAKEAAPRELTDFDLAYLRTVYQGVDSLNAASKLASINTKLRTVQAERSKGETAD